MVDSKENLGDSFNRVRKPEVCIPGVIDDCLSGTPSPARGKRATSGYIATSFPQASTTSVAQQNSPPAPRIVVASPPQTLPVSPSDNQPAYSPDDMSSILSEEASIILSPGQAVIAQRQQIGAISPQETMSHTEELQAFSCRGSTQSGSTYRSCEYLTPEATPRISCGVGATSGQRSSGQRPTSALIAPSGQPQPPSKDVSVCARTGTVIPSVPPMPSAALRSENARNVELPCLTPPDCCGSDEGLPEVLPLPKRPYSAAIDDFASCRSSSSQGSRRQTDSARRELCYPPNVLSAARHGRYADVEAALIAGFVPNYADSYGNTIFHIACQNGRRRIAKLALKYGCDINARNMKGNTGLHFLFAYGYPDIAEYFIKKGANECITNSLGKTAREGIK